MGKIEEKVKKRLKRNTLKKVVLNTIAVAGVMSVALLAPNAMQMLKMFGIHIGNGNRRKELIKRSYNNLLEQGYLKNNNDFLEVTNKGKMLLESLNKGEVKIVKPKKWDRKWRVLIFDINEKYRFKRDKLRRTLISIGFMRLQDSVWIFPYDCEDLVTLLKKDFKLGKDLLYLIVEEIEGDNVLKNSFGLTHYNT